MCMCVCCQVTNNPLQDGYTPLHRAAFNGHTEIVQMLITNSACVDCVNKVEERYLSLTKWEVGFTFFLYLKV